MKKLFLLLALLVANNALSQTYADKVAKSKALVGQPVQTHTFYTLDKKPVSFEDFKGEPVVAYFFASWCSPCYGALTNLHQAIEDTPPTVRVVAISLDEEWENLDRMLNKTGFTGEVWKWDAAESALQQRLFANFSGSLPHIIRVNDKGILIEAGSRIKTAEQWSAVINQQRSLHDASKI